MFNQSQVQSPTAFSRKNGLSPVKMMIEKPKPAKARVVAEIKQALKNPQNVDGDGRLYIGSNATDMVYRTKRNSQGGTDGSFKITARFAVEITDLVNSIVFTVQLDPAYLGGVQVQGIATDDPELSSASISNFAFTDNGGGNYTFGPWTSSGAKTYYGFEIELTPVDPTNDATLHDEYFVIQDMTIVQNGNNLLSQQEVIATSTWAQQVKRAFPAAFTTQTLASLNGNDVYIAHTQNITGAFSNYLFASNNGSGDGAEVTPMSLENAVKQLNAGACEILVLKSGAYSWTGQKPNAVFDIDSTDYAIVACLDGVAEIDCGVDVASGSLNVSGSHYTFAYTDTNHYNESLITGGSAGAHLVALGIDEVLTEQTSAANVDANPFTYWYDQAANTFHVNLNGTPRDLVICEAGQMVRASDCGAVKTLNLKARGMQAHCLNYSNVEWFESFNVGNDIGNPLGDSFDIDDSSGFHVDDYCTKAGNDGFNYHGTGHTELYDCQSTKHLDDGCSHHDSCTGYIQGGSYTDNGKGGVIPAFGARVVAVGVNSQNNNAASSPVVNGDNYGGFVCLSNDSDLNKTILECYDCVSDNDGLGFNSCGGQSQMTVIQGEAKNNSKGIYSSTWAANTSTGIITRIEVAFSGNTADVEGGKVRKMTL